MPEPHDQVKEMECKQENKEDDDVKIGKHNIIIV